MLLLPFSVVARFGGLWLFWVLLGELTLFLFWERTCGLAPGPIRGGSLFLTLAALNAGLSLGWEALRRRGVPWLQGRLAPRLLAGIALFVSAGVLDVFLADASFGRARPPLSVAWLVFLVVYGPVLLFYRAIARDLLVLALFGLTTASVITALFAILLLDVLDLEVFGVFLLGLSVLGQSVLGQMALLAAWLRHEQRRGNG